jgi:peptidoglycan/xylan/chitin deacetylase (PgdA/CDA1 family)
MIEYQSNERRVPWPDGIQCPVVLNFHPDGESLAIAVDKENARRPCTQTMYTYGPRVGMQRILRLLSKYDLRASFYIPAITAERHPYMIDWIVAGGHEIGCHGYTHDWPNWLEPDVEEEHLDRQIEVLTRMSGTRPRGYISPGWEYSEQTLGLLRARGIEFSGDWLGEDIPYYVEVDGEQTDFVAIPVNWTLDDAPLYWFALFPPLSYGAPYAEPSRVFEIWTSEFDSLYEEGALFHLTMHPFLSGRGCRVKTLERLIQYILQRPGVKFCTMAEVADMYKQVVTREQGRPGVWYPARGGEAPQIVQIDGVPIYT